MKLVPTFSVTVSRWFVVMEESNRCCRHLQPLLTGWRHQHSWDEKLWYVDTRWLYFVNLHVCLTLRLCCACYKAKINYDNNATAKYDGNGGWWCKYDHMFQTLVVSLVLTRLDYGNWLPVAGLPVYLVWRLQSVLNAAARLIYHIRRSDHISDTLACFHWLRVPGRIEFKIAVLTYKCPSRSCAGVPRPFYTCRRPTQSTIVDAAFCRHQSLGSAYQQTVDCW